MRRARRRRRASESPPAHRSYARLYRKEAGGWELEVGFGLLRLLCRFPWLRSTPKPTSNPQPPISSPCRSEQEDDTARHAREDPPLVLECDALAPRRDERVDAQAGTVPGPEPVLEPAAAVHFRAARRIRAAFLQLAQVTGPAGDERHERALAEVVQHRSS